MTFKSKLKSIAFMLILVLLVTSGCTLIMPGMFSNESSATENADGTVTISKDEYEQLKKYADLQELLDIVNQSYYKPIDQDELIEYAKKGLLAGIGDPYTFYYTPEEYEQFWADDKGEYAGVGMQITSYYSTLECVISRVFKDSPAEAGGIHKKDILYRVEDILVDAYNLQEAVDIMRGEIGQSVEIEVIRDGENIIFNLDRAHVVINRVEYTMLEDNIGYIVLYEFSSNTVDSVQAAIDDLLSQGMASLIFDLRDNPGGWINDAVAIADIFLDKSVVVYSEYKSGFRSYEYSKDGRLDMPLVVMINENSASASELLSGALQDYGVATILGVQSYGKGIVQSVLPVGSDGAGMQFTIAQYFTPNGNQVHEIGIAPDIEVALPEGDKGMYELGDMSDVQLQKAVEVIKTKMQ